MKVISFRSVILSVLMPMFTRREKSRKQMVSILKLAQFISIVLICICCIKLFQLSLNIYVMRTEVKCSAGLQFAFVALNSFLVFKFPFSLMIFHQFHMVRVNNSIKAFRFMTKQCVH